MVALSLAVMTACGGGTPDAPPPPPGTAIESGGMVRSVNVTLDDSGLNPDQGQAVADYGVAEGLQSGITATLGTRGALSESGRLDVSVVIYDFRLRSGASAFWLGNMAGADLLKVKVEVKDGGRSVRSFETNASTTLGGIAYASPTRRSARLTKAVSIRVADGL
jgi:hypothetical protein